MKIGNYVAGSILFLAIMACAVPGLGQSAVAPTFDLNVVPTMVALTANAAMTQTAVAAPPLLLTESSTPDPSAINGTLELLPNGNTKYTDNEIAIEVTFPTGWLTLRANSDEFSSALENEAVKNDMLREQMELDLSDYEPGVDRLYSYPLRPDIEKNYAFGFSKLKWDPDNLARIDENSMGELVRGLEASGGIPGFRADTAQVYENGNQVKVIEVGGQFSISDGQGGTIPFYLTAIFFKPSNNSTVLITFTYLKDYKLPIYADVTAVIASIQILEQ